jgi:tetratricopeptide (TPR) repeat protein
MPVRSLWHCLVLALPLAFALTGCIQKDLFSRIQHATSALAVPVQVSPERKAQATLLIEQSLPLGRQGDYQASIQLLNQALELDPSSDRAYYNRGTMYMEQQDYQPAIADFNQALVLNPKRVFAYINRGNVWRRIGEFDKALADYQTAQRLDPQDYKPHMNRGIVYQDMKAYEKSLAAYAQALVLAPDEASIYYNRALTYRDIQRLPEALADYNQAIRLSPDYLAAFINRAIVKRNLRDFPGALADLNQAIQLAPDFPKPYFNRGDIYALMGRYPLAISDYTKALDLGHHNQAGLYSSRATARSRLGDRDGAIADIRRVIELSQGRQEPQNQKIYQLAQKRLQELLMTGQVGIDFDTAWASQQALYEKATQKIHQGDYQGAIADFTFLVEQQPNQLAYYNNRGIAYSRAGQHQQSAADFSKVIELNPQWPEGYFNRGLEYRFLGETAKAKQDFETTLRLSIAQGFQPGIERVKDMLQSLPQ